MRGLLPQRRASRHARAVSPPWGRGRISTSRPRRLPWQKSDKRNRVVRQILTRSPLPFFYVNQVGAQNNGKNIIVFDGDSTAYAADGHIACRAHPWRRGTARAHGPAGRSRPSQSEIEAQYAGILTGLRHLNDVRGAESKFLIATSGGVDSSVVLLSAGARLWSRARVCGQHADALQCRGYPRQLPARCAPRCASITFAARLNRCTRL